MDLTKAKELIGKRVLLKLNDGTLTGGILGYVGYNDFFPSWNIQVSIDGCPYPNINLNNLSLYIPKPLIITENE